MTGDKVEAAMRFLSAMPAWLGDDGEVWFEGPRWPESLTSQLSPWRLRKSRPQVIERGTFWPRSKLVGIRCTAEAVRLIVQASDDLAAHEICDHFHVYEGDSRIASWYDFGLHSAPDIAGHVGDERLRRLAELL